MQNIVLAFATNMFGQLKPDIIERIENYLENPTIENWDDIHSIIIKGGGRMTTIWQAVIAYDDTFPTKGRSYNDKWEVVREWSKIPSQETLIEALKKQLLNKDDFPIN